MEEDPSISFTQDTQTGEFILGGLGEQHLEVAAAKLKSKFGSDIDLVPKQEPFGAVFMGMVLGITLLESPYELPGLFPGAGEDEVDMVRHQDEGQDPDVGPGRMHRRVVHAHLEVLFVLEPDPVGQVLCRNKPE